MKIWANTIVNNEENFIWFAVMSVVDYVDKVLIWDTGSTDRTIDIIKEIRKIKGEKVEFKEVGDISREEFPKMRQKMLESSKADWILVLDGDEIWWEDSIKKVIKKITEGGDKIEGIVVPTINPVGDIYHIQEEAAGKYELLGRKGHLNLRAINRRIPGLHVDLPHPLEGYFDGNNRLVHERGKTVFVDAPYLHVTHLIRSSAKKRINKFKSELGNLVENNFQYPEVLKKSYPSFINSPWVKISGMAYIKSKLLTPLRKIIRRIR